jgi:NADH dehydrogenase FAD-containing subunit
MIDGDDILLKNQMAEIFSDELQNEVTHHFSKENVEFLTRNMVKFR